MVYILKFSIDKNNQELQCVADLLYLMMKHEGNKYSFIDSS